MSTEPPDRASLPDSSLPDSSLPDSSLPDSSLPDSSLPDSSLIGSILLDTAHCPVCRSPLQSSRCRSCGTDLSGELGQQFWDNSQRIVALYRERDELVRRARAAGAPTPGAQTVVPAAIPPAAIPPAEAPPSPVPLTSARPTTAPASAAPASAAPGSAASGSAAPDSTVSGSTVPPATVPARTPIGVQTLLVGLGALLLSVAAVVFLVFSWNRLGLLGRAGVILGFTLLVLVLAARLRRRLPGTGEAVGAFGAVLVLADAWAVRATGLGGADDVDAAAFWAVALAVCVLVLAGFGRWTGVRAASVAAAGLAPPAAVAAGLGSALPHDPGFVAGLLGGALVALARPALPGGWSLERRVLRVAACLGLVLGGWVAGCVAVAGGDVLVDRGGGPDLGHRVLAAALLAGGALVAAGQAAADRHQRQLTALWSSLAGLFAAATAAAAAIAAVDASGAALVWTITVMPLLTGLVSAALADRGLPRPPLPGLSRPLTSQAATVGWGLATLPAAGVLALAAAWAASAGPFDAWTRSAGDALLTRPDADRIWLAAGLGLALTALLAWLRVARGRGRNRRLWPPAATLVTGAALIAGALAPRLAIGAVIGLLALTGLGAAALAGLRRASRRALLAVAAAAGLVAVLASWAVDVLSVPTTLAGAAALVGVRRVVSGPRVRAVLLALATTASVPAAGGLAGLLGRPMPDRIVAAGCVGVLLAAAALTVRLPGVWTRVERLAAAAPGLAAVLLAIVVTAARADWPLHGAGLHRMQVLFIVLIAATGLCLLSGARTARTVELAAAVALPPVVTAGVVLLVRGLLPGLTPAVVGAAAVGGIAVGFAALVHDRLGRPRPPLAPGEPPRRPSGIRECVEAGIAVTAVVPLACTPHLPALSLVLLLLGSGAVAIAGTPGRARLGWLAGVLLTASSWVRLGINDVRVVEPYSVPPAVALLCLAVLRLRRDRGLAAWKVLALPALGGLLPSVIASGRGSVTRPCLLLAVSAAFVLVAWRWPVPPNSDPTRRLRRGRAGVDAALLALATLTAAGTGLVRPLGALASDVPVLGADRVELWCLPAAAVALAAVAVAWRRGLAGPWRGGSVPVAGPLLAVPLLVASLPVLVAAVDAGHGTPRALGVLLVAGAAAVAAQRARLVFVVGASLAVATVAALAGLFDRLGPAPEVWTVPLGAALAGVGALRLAADPARRSWAELGLPLAVALVPPLLVAADSGGTLRIALLTVGSAAVLLAGAVRRLAAPLLLGSAVLAAHALIQLAPWLRSVYHALPGWVGLAVVGILLLAVGATYERRLQQLRALRLRISALR